MYDKLDLEIPLDPNFVQEFNSSRDGMRAGFVDISDFDFKAIQTVTYKNGVVHVESTKTLKWDSIASSISQVAVGFYPEGNGFNEWPHVRVKCSPAKILQGHNVFGPETLRAGAMQMISMASLAFPKLFARLEIREARVRYVDCTYSTRIESDFYKRAVFRLIKATAKSDTKYNDKHKGYLKLGLESEYVQQKVYEKDCELVEDIKTAKRENKHERLKVLEDERLLEFSKNLLRFEATIGHRKFERLGIPTRLNDFLRFQEWHDKVYNQPLCQYLWKVGFEKIFAQIEGHTMKKVDDDAIRARIYAKLVKVSPTGRVNRRTAKAVWDTYEKIKSKGYSELCHPDDSTFFRHVGILVKEIGLSRAFLKTLGPDHPEENIIPIVELIKIDFTKQRPDWYVEPEAGYDDARRHLKLVG